MTAIRASVIAAALAIIWALLSAAGAGASVAPYPTQQQVTACARAVTNGKPMSVVQVRGCKAAVQQTFEPQPCPKDPTNPLDTQYVNPSGYLIDLGHGYHGVRGKAAHEWAIRAGHKAFLIASGKVTQEQIDASICS